MLQIPGYQLTPKLPPKSTGFFDGQCATFPPNFVKIHQAVFG